MKCSSRLPRFLIAAEKSGQGKTMLTCALLSLFSSMGQTMRAFKCGPDYIDPMFHRHVLGIPSYNLDSFFVDPNTLRFLLGRHGAAENETMPLAILEGVMGYYDGLGGVSERASAYEIARLTDTPVLFVADASGRSVSILASIQGYLSYRPDHGIGGILFNRLSPALYPALKEKAQRELGIPVLGYIPAIPEFSLESRHLGLVMPGEIPKLQSKLKMLSEAIRPGIDVEGILSMARVAAPLSWNPVPIPKQCGGRPKIAVAKDEAFCFYYADNLELLSEMGAELLFFSPLHSEAFPAEADGVYLGGGYPELYAKELAGNQPMRRGLLERLNMGMPCIAECGGFLYLLEALKDPNGISYPMTGFLCGEGENKGRLSRFGYVTLSAKQSGLFGEPGLSFRAHEFHHWDTKNPGAAFHAEKPVGTRSWDCAYTSGHLYAGFPHLYFYNNLTLPERFLQAAILWSKRRV